MDNTTMDDFSSKADLDFMEINPDGKNKIGLPYASFRFGIRWKVDRIAGHKKANGFIVQKINVSAPDYLRSFPVKEYFEAWEVQNGKIKYPTNAIPEIMDEIKAITIEGYEDTFQDFEDGPYANDEIVTYSMKEKKQVARSIGIDYIESEGTGGRLVFKREVTKEATPDGYFEEKRKAIFFDEEEFQE